MLTVCKFDNPCNLGVNFVQDVVNKKTEQATNVICFAVGSREIGEENDAGMRISIINTVRVHVVEEEVIAVRPMEVVGNGTGLGVGISVVRDGESCGGLGWNGEAEVIPENTPKISRVCFESGERLDAGDHGRGKWGLGEEGQRLGKVNGGVSVGTPYFDPKSAPLVVLIEVLLVGIHVRDEWGQGGGQTLVREELVVDCLPVGSEERGPLVRNSAGVVNCVVGQSTLGVEEVIERVRV